MIFLSQAAATGFLGLVLLFVLGFYLYRGMKPFISSGLAALKGQAQQQKLARLQNDPHKILSSFVVHQSLKSITADQKLRERHFELLELLVDIKEGASLIRRHLPDLERVIEEQVRIRNEALLSEKLVEKIQSSSGRDWAREEAERKIQILSEELRKNSLSFNQLKNELLSELSRAPFDVLH